MKRTRHAFLTRLKSFVNSLLVASNTPVFSSDNNEMKDEIERLFSKMRLYCESSSLAATKNISDAVLVTDDQFLFAMAHIEGLPTIGLTGLLSKSNSSWDSLLSASKKLKDMNYGNYLPVHLYKRIVDRMLDSEAAYEAASAEIQTWIMSDTDGNPTQYHENVIITLFRDVIEQNLDYLNPDNFLMSIILDILEKRNPGFIEKCIADAFKASMSTSQEDSYEITQ